MDHYEAQHAGNIRVLFGTCAYCTRKAAWDFRRKRCLVCEKHGDPTTPLSRIRERAGYRPKPPEPLVVVTVQTPGNKRGITVGFERDMLAAYGGYSRTTVAGVWRNPSDDSIVREYMLRYEIAMTPGQARVFREHRAKRIRTMFEQDALYFTIGGQGFTL